MLVLDAEKIMGLVSIPELVEALRAGFQTECLIPPRQIVSMPGNEAGRLFVSMPAFTHDGAAAVKLVTLFPDNPDVGMPTIQAAVVVFSERGTPVALLDGTAVTRLRTAAASALASQYLSRTDSSHLAMVGTGELAPMMVAAHCAVRPIKRVSIWGRRDARARATASTVRALIDDEIEIVLPDSLEGTVRSADIVSCATSSETPIVTGRWLKPGTFVDLVGSFSPSKREVDDEVILRSRVFVDTLAGALAEAGDILDPMRRGVIDRARIIGDLADLTRGRQRGRETAGEIITFKSVGTALEDLVAAHLIVAAASKNTSSGAA